MKNIDMKVVGELIKTTETEAQKDLRLLHTHRISQDEYARRRGNRENKFDDSMRRLVQETK